MHAQSLTAASAVRYNAFLPVCVTNIQPLVDAGVRACCIAADSLVLFVTWKATYASYKQVRLFKVRSELAQQLISDGE